MKATATLWVLVTVGPSLRWLILPFFTPSLHNLSVQSFHKSWRGLFSGILNLHLLLKLLFNVYTSPKIYTPHNTAAAVERKCLEEHKRWDFFEVEWLSVEWMQVKISPNQQKIVSVGEEGAILIWDYRKPISNSPPDATKDVKVVRPGSPK